MKDYNISHNLYTSKENTLEDEDNKRINVQHSDQYHYTNYFITPNLLVRGDLKLDPYTYRLYSHLVCVAGQTGTCWMSNNTLASECGMSIDSVRKAKKTLSMPFAALDGKPLINIHQRYQKKTNRQLTDLIEIVFIWDNNSKFFNKDKPVDEDIIYVKKTLENDEIQKMFPGSVKPTPPLAKPTPPLGETNPNNTHLTILNKEEEESIYNRERARDEPPPTSSSSSSSFKNKSELPKQTPLATYIFEKLNLEESPTHDMSVWESHLDKITQSEDQSVNKLKLLVSWVLESPDSFWRDKIHKVGNFINYYPSMYKQFSEKKSNKQDLAKEQEARRFEKRLWCYPIQRQDHLLPSGIKIEITENGLMFKNLRDFTCVDYTYIDYLENNFENTVKNTLNHVGANIRGLM